ncbi:protein of unknown function [Magnetospirillum sp. XM-1]|nr:protein of unknown function [Magnetospirillum sp. XM-1]
MALKAAEQSRRSADGPKLVGYRKCQLEASIRGAISAPGLRGRLTVRKGIASQGVSQLATPCPSV